MPGGGSLKILPEAGAALLATARRELSQAWSALPFERGLNAAVRVSGLAATPRDFRPTDPDAGREILAGRFTLAGATLETGPGGDPLDRASPNRRFAVELHRFSWLPDLLACGEPGAEEALRLFKAWRELFDRPNPFVWGGETLERRVFHLACGARRLTAAAPEGQGLAVLKSLAVQALALMRLPEEPSRSAERLTVAALAGVALNGSTGAGLAAKSLRVLPRALNTAVLPDGGHRTRSPEAALELLFDLMSLDDALLQRGRESPPEVGRTMDRLGAALHFFTLGDERLASFQGGGICDPERVRAAMIEDEGESRPFAYAPHSGYHRLSGADLHLIADAGAPADGAWSTAACAQPLAIEVAYGRERLIANAGWRPGAPGGETLRLTAAGCTAQLEDASAGRPLTGFLARALGPRLVEGPQKVEARRNENESGQWLELSHDGWVEAFGLTHERRLFLDPKSGELRGEDRFTPANPAKASRGGVRYAVRFHIWPDISVSLARDKRSVLLRGEGERAWWLRNDAPEVSLEGSVHIVLGLPRDSVQVVLRGEVPAGETARVRWKLTPAKPSSPAAKPAAAAQEAALV